MKIGEIWLAQLDPKLGSEIQKARPCVVVSPNESERCIGCAS
jgi:mRNA interferase MazF